MSKVQTIYHPDGNKIVVERTQDCQSVLDRTAAMRSAEMVGSSDMRFVGSIPAGLLEKWINEAGITMDQTEAVQEVINRHLMSGDFNKLRVWEGTF